MILFQNVAHVINRHCQGVKTSSHRDICDDELVMLKSK